MGKVGYKTVYSESVAVHASTAGGSGSIPGQGSSTCLVVQPKKRKEQYMQYEAIWFIWL